VSRRLILPGDTKPGLQILVPRGYEDDGTLPDQTPVGLCLICEAKFYRGQEDEWQRHVGACARAHRAEIEEALEKRRKSIFNEDNWDPEIAAHMREVGERMKREGRLEVLPSERAGF
jgi:hypothetical protein